MRRGREQPGAGRCGRGPDAQRLRRLARSGAGVLVKIGPAVTPHQGTAGLG